jgi:hypothetical protein
VVLEGALSDRGMPNFKGMLTQQDLDALRTYLAKRSYEDFGGKPR